MYVKMRATRIHTHPSCDGAHTALFRFWHVQRNLLSESLETLVAAQENNHFVYVLAKITQESVKDPKPNNIIASKHNNNNNQSTTTTPKKI